MTRLTYLQTSCILLVLSIGISIGYGRSLLRDVPTPNDPRYRCSYAENSIPDLFEDCKYGHYSDCGRMKCVGGPGDECRQDNPKGCHEGLACACNRCMGCLGPNCFGDICPSRNWINRFERNMREFEE